MTNPWRPTRRDLLRLGGGLAAVGATAGLAACGGKGLTDDSSDTGNSESGAANMQFMYWGSTYEQKAVNKMLASYKEDHPEDTVKPLFTPSDYDTKMNALVASNRAPDVAYMNAGPGYRLADQGKLVNLYDYFDKYPALADRLEGSYFWWDQGKTYGTQSANETMQLFYSKPAFADAGVDLPPAAADQAWSWDTFVANAYELTLDQSGKTPDQDGFDPKKIRQFGASINWWEGTWYPLLLSNGTDFANEDGSKSLLDSPEAIQVFQNLTDLMYKHRVAPTPTQLGNNAPSTTVQLKTRRIAMVFDGQWTLLDLSQGNLDFGIGVLPKLQTPMTASMGGATAIFSSTDHPEDAVEFYLYHNDPTKVDLFSSGLWMPLEKKYYTDQADIDLWTKNDVHPPEYRTAVIDYTLNNSKVLYTQKLKNIDKITPTVTAALQVIQSGKQPAADVLKPLAAKLNDGMLQGTYPLTGA